MEEAAMGIFTNSKSKKNKVILSAGSRCSKCGRKIHQGENFSCMDGKLLCEKCTRRKKDLDFFGLLAMIDD
jgi:formylmethanofuran dehydrogenase subunit E